jgi:hypothetical protein
LGRTSRDVDAGAGLGEELFTLKKNSQGLRAGPRASGAKPLKKAKEPSTVPHPADPLANLIRGKKITPRQAFLGGMLIIGIIEHTLVPIAFGYPNPFNGGLPYIFHYLVDLFQAGFVTPLAYAIYVWTIATPDTLRSLFVGLRRTPSPESEEKITAWYDGYQASLSRKGNLFLVSGLTIFYTAWVIYSLLTVGPEPWFGRSNYTHLGFVAFTTALAQWVIWWIAVREVLAVGWMRKFFAEKVDISISPSHPDKCGGLGVIGTHATRFGFFVLTIAVAFGLQIAVTVSYNAVANVYGIIQLSSLLIFVVLVFYIFYSLLIPAHREMVRYKIEFLTTLSLSIRDQLVSPHDAKTLAGSARNIGTLSGLYAFVQKELPTWPIKRWILRGVAITTIIEILSLAASILSLIIASRA